MGDAAVTEATRLPLADPQSPPSVGLQSPLSPDDDVSDDDDRGSRKRAAANLTTHERRTANKVCRVCGDKAFSYNFNVITCESCKAFFRRNANKEKEIRCPFSEQCEINIVSRRFCQRCRLQKCFNVGMKKEWIMTEEARLEKKQRVEENRERRFQESLVKGKLLPNQLKHRLKSDSSSLSSPGSASFRSPSLLDSTPSTVSSERTHLGLEGSLTQAAAANFRPHSLLSTTSMPGTPASVGAADCFGGTSTQQIMAHAQLAAAQVQLQQAHIEHQIKQQIVAQAQQQIAAQQQQQQIEVAVAAALGPQQTLVLQQSAPQTIHQNMAPTLAQNISHQLLPPLTQTLTITHEPLQDPNTVTLPKEVFLRLLETSNVAAQQPREKPVKCSCTCLCGRYAQGELIVDEVMKELLAGSSSSAAAHAPEIPPAEPYEAHEMHIDGLIPGAQSSVQWLNSTPLSSESIGLLTPSPMLTEPSASEDVRFGGFYRNSSLLEMEIHQAKVDPDCRLLTSADKDRIQEVVSSNVVWSTEMLDPNEKKKHENKCPNKAQMVNMADGAIRRLIKMTKRIDAFRKIDQADQIKLLKSTCMDYLILRGAMSYDPKENIWTGPTPSAGYQIKMDAMKDSQNMFEHSIRFYSTFKEELRTNEQVMLLLGMCIIFNGDVPGLNARDAVVAENMVYQRILKRLLFQLFNHNVQKTQTEFKGLMDKLRDIKELNRHATMMVKELGASDLEPLLVEMFD